MHFSAIFITEVDGFYRDILGKSGAPPQSAASKASCWSLVTKLLRVLFKEIHKVRVEAVGLENIRDDVARVNGSFLYAALEELRVLREFHGHEYRQHPKFHHNVVMHLFDTALPRSVYEARTDGAGRDTLKLTRLKNAVADQGTSIDCLETAVGTMRQGCENIPTWISLSGDLAFSHQDGIYGLNFPRGFRSSLGQRAHFIHFIYFIDPNHLKN